MRRALLLVAVLASVAVACWSIATTRPAGTGVGAAPVASDASRAPGEPTGAVAVSVTGAATVEVASPASNAPSTVGAARQPVRPLLGGLAAAVAILLGLGLVRPAVAGRSPSPRHRIARSLPPFSVAALRGPPSVTARLLTA
jgi:hypothetical protein